MWVKETAARIDVVLTIHAASDGVQTCTSTSFAVGFINGENFVIEAWETTE